MWSKPSIPQISPKEPFILRFYQSRDVLVQSWNKQNGASLLADHKHELEFLFHSLFCVQCLGLYGSSAQWQCGSQMNEWTVFSSGVLFGEWWCFITKLKMQDSASTALLPFFSCSLAPCADYQHSSLTLPSPSSPSYLLDLFCALFNTPDLLKLV